MPRSLVCRERWNPVCVSRSCTVAPTAGAPVGSRTTPRMIPVVAWDCAAIERNAAPHASAATTSGTARCKGLSMGRAPPGEMVTGESSDG